MKYLTIFVMSVTALFFVACSSSGGEEPTDVPEPTDAPAMATAVSTEAPEPTEESYPASEDVLSLPADPYPGEETSDEANIIIDYAYPAEVDLADVVSEPNGYPPQEAPQPGIPGDKTAVIAFVSQQLATRLSNDISEITLVSAEEQEWADSSLGCPASGYAYAQVITPGYQIILEADGEEYTYHTDLNGNIVLCGEDGHPVE